MGTAPKPLTESAIRRLTSDALTTFLSEASDLILQARGAELFTADLLEQAAEKAQDAIKLRPGSFNANMLAGEIGVKRAMIADTTEAIELLEESAVPLPRKPKRA